MKNFFQDIKLALFVAKKMILKGSKTTSFLLIFILSVAFLNLLFIKGFLFGFSDGILQSVINSGASHIIIKPEEKPVMKKYIFNESLLRKEIETIPGVVATTYHYISAATISYDKEKNGLFRSLSVPVIGIDPQSEKLVSDLHKHMVDGVFPDELKDDEVILGSNVSGGYDRFLPIDLDGVKSGEKVHILYANGIDKIYTVKGIFRVNLGYASNNVLVSSKEIERMLAVHDQASEILIKLDLDYKPVGQYLERLKMMYPHYKIDDYTKLLAVVGVLVNSFDLIALVVTLISVVVSFATIFVMIYINATSKQKQIGILKAIGINERIIDFSYLFQSFFYATLSVIAGTFFLFFVIVPLLHHYPIPMPYGYAYLVLTKKDILMATILMLLSSIVAGFIPANIVSRREILKIIWS